jgi:hypothetical protein
LVSAIWRELSSFWNICGALNVSFFLDKYLSYQIFSYVNISQLLGICDYHNTLELYCTCIKCWNLLTLQEFYVCLLSTSFTFLFYVYINWCIYQNNMANWLIFMLVCAIPLYEIQTSWTSTHFHFKETEVILCRPFGLLGPKDILDYFTFQSLIMFVLDEGYSRNASCSLHFISTFVFQKS